MTRVSRNLADAAQAAEPYFSANDSAAESEASCSRAEFSSQVDDWAQAAGPDEDREEAARRLLECWDRESTLLDLSELGLTSLPACVNELYQLEELDLSANLFEQVPVDLMDLHSDCLIWAGDNPLPALEARRFNQISGEHGGPQLLQLARPNDAGGDGWQTLDLNQSVRLPEALAAWREDLGKCAATARDWHDSGHENAASFGGWLTRLREVEPFANPAGRQLICERVRALLAAMNEDPLLRETCFHIAFESVGSCNDNVMLGLNRFEMALQNRRAEQGMLSASEVFELGRGMFRLTRLQEIAEDTIAQRTRDGVQSDPVEVHLAYQVGLRERLGLPIPSLSMQFLALSGVGELALRQAARRVLEAEGSRTRIALRHHRHIMAKLADRSTVTLPKPGLRNALACFLAEHYQPWQQHVARVRAGELAAHAEVMFGYLERVEASKDAGRISEFEYVERLNEAQFYANHGVAYAAALERLVELEAAAAR